MSIPLSNKNRKIVYAGKLIDGVSNQVRTNVSVIIENGRIREVQNRKGVVPDAELVDLSDSTVMPGSSTVILI